MSINRIRITPTPSNTATNTPTITPTQTTCPNICFSGDGFNDLVNSIIQDNLSNNKIVCVGSFTTFNGVNRENITRIYTDGEIDYTFNSGTGFGLAEVSQDIKQQIDYKYVVVGNFTSYRGTSRRGIVRINYDGTLDTSFVIGTGFTGMVQQVEILSNGSMIVGGDMTQFSGTSIGKLCKLSSSGSLDTSFSTTAITSGDVRKIVSNNDGTFYVSGSFTMPGGRRNIILLNSDGTYSSGNTFNSSGVGTVGAVNDFEVLSDGKLFLVGDFISYNGTSRGRAVRINSNGTIDTSFTTGLGYSNVVYETITQGSKYINIGFYSTYSGISVNNITRLNGNGTLDTTWNSGNFTSTVAEDSIIHLLKLTGNTIDSGYIFAAGFFNSYDGVLTNNIVKMNSDGYAVDCDPIVVSPTPTRTPTRTPTSTPTRTIGLTPSITPTITITSTPTRTPGLTPSITPTITTTSTPTATIGLTPTSTPSNTPTITPTTTNTPTNTPTSTTENTPTITPTNTITPSITSTITPSTSSFYYYSIKEFDCANSCSYVSPDLVGRSSIALSTLDGVYYKLSTDPNVYQIQTEITPAPMSWDINLDGAVSNANCGSACLL